MWNIANNRKHPPARYATDIRYYELKSKYEFLVAIGSLVAASAIFYGISTKKELEQSLKADFALSVDSTRKELQVAKTDVKELAKWMATTGNLTQQKVNQSEKKLDDLFGKQNQLDRKRLASQFQIDDLLKQTNDIRKKDILKRDFYIVDSLIIPMSELDDDGMTNVSFSILKTASGNPLPIFDNPPMVFVSPLNGINVQIGLVTTKYFKVMNAIYMPEEVSKTGKAFLRLLIMEQN